jgi:DNA recombination protein RmuC
MSGMEWVWVGIIVLVGLQVVLLVMLWQRSGNALAEGVSGRVAAQVEARLGPHLVVPLVQQMGQQMRQEVGGASERLERELRDEVRGTSTTQRAEWGQGLAQLQQSVNERLTQSASLQTEQTGQQMRAFSQTLVNLTESNERRLVEIRTTLETKLRELQADNAAKLEEMRKTVDERLHATLEQRLGESFKQVSDRLEQVHRGLGEMQSLASGVGDLKRVLTNVKTRGTWGEIQLGALLEQVLTPEQYATNIATRPGSNARVEFAVKMPGRGQAVASPLWLPIDAKFPTEDYERLLVAQDAADAAGVEEAAKALETRIRFEAKQMSEKYVEPPHTTDFAILFVPTEGLYAELLRRPGLADGLQRDYKVAIAGPTTLNAILTSLQMGFRTLAIEQRSAEVWQVLGAVKTEFGKFGEVLAATKKQLQTVANSIDHAETRTRQMERKLRQVEQLPDTQAQALLATPRPAGLRGPDDD